MTGRTRVAVHAGIACLATSLALDAVFSGWGWFLPVAGAIAIVVAVNELTRWSPLPSSLGPLLAVGVLLCFCTALYAGSTAWGHLIPSGESLRQLQAVARSGFRDIRTLATPVPTHDGLVLVSAVGVAAVALVVDLFAVTMRRAALAGLPLLALFAICTSVAKSGAGWLPFVVASAGYLWLLLADSRERLARWGRPLGYDRAAMPRFTWSDTEAMPAPLAVLGRRIGVSAIAIAVVVPLLVPGLRGGVPHGHGTGLGLGHGSASAITINPIVAIQAQLTAPTSQPVMTVRTSDADPGYLRLTSLDRFDGSTFAPSTLEAPTDAAVSRGLPPPGVTGPPQTSQISIDGLAVRWLPVPSRPTSVSVSGDWLYDSHSQTIFSARTDTRGLSYSVVSVPPHPTAAALELASRTLPTDDPAVTTALQLPAIDPRVRQLTAQVTRNAVTPFDKALAIQNFLTGGQFHYDLTVRSGDSATALANFLLVSRSGFCQQFAAAMAVMARIEHIPARVAVGFTRGELQQDGSWLVTTYDAHAWPELYFPGFGWLAFEPTPRGDGQTQEPSYAVPAAAPGPAPGTTKPGKRAGGKGGAHDGLSKNRRLDQAADAHGLGPAPKPAVRHRDGPSGRALAGWILLAVVLGMLTVPLLVRVWSRRRRWRQAESPAARATAAWAELRASAIDARAGWVDGLSPRATAAVLRAEGGLAPAEARALDRIVAAVERAWYAPRALSPGLSDLRDDVETIRAGWLAEATVGERWMLRLWPRSALRDLRAATGRIGESLDAIDVAAARLRARLRGRPGGAASAPRVAS